MHVPRLWAMCDWGEESLQLCNRFINQLHEFDAADESFDFAEYLCQRTVKAFVRVRPCAAPVPPLCRRLVVCAPAQCMSRCTARHSSASFRARVSRPWPAGARNARA